MGRIVIEGKILTKGKEMITIDDEGLTINGGFYLPTVTLLGPVPWDCISSARAVRIMLDKYLWVVISDVPRLTEIMGEEAVQNCLLKVRKTGEMVLSIDLQLCKLKGLDPAALINERAKGILHAENA